MTPTLEPWRPHFCRIYFKRSRHFFEIFPSSPASILMLGSPSPQGTGHPPPRGGLTAVVIVTINAQIGVFTKT